jgi:hypothetical protein
VKYIDVDEIYSEKVIKEICEEFPFLIPKRNGKVVPDYDYTYLWLEIPAGWYNLFLQMCGDIKPILEKYDMLDSFEFVQVKEKYNGLRCYHNLDYQNVLACKEIEHIINKYEYMAQFVCTRCGDIATCVMNKGWISSYCDECIGDLKHLDVLSEIEFEPYYIQLNFDNEERIKVKVSFEDEWNRYKNLIGAE